MQDARENRHKCQNRIAYYREDNERRAGPLKGRQVVGISKDPLIPSTELSAVPRASIFNYFLPTNNQACPFNRLKITGEDFRCSSPKGIIASNDTYAYNKWSTRASGLFTAWLTREPWYSIRICVTSFCRLSFGRRNAHFKDTLKRYICEEKTFLKIYQRSSTNLLLLGRSRTLWQVFVVHFVITFIGILRYCMYYADVKIKSLTHLV